MEQIELSIIIPIRTSVFDFYRSRLALRENQELRQQIETLVIDDGSPASVSREIEAFCLARRYRYLRLDTERLAFSLSRARNAGLSAARGTFIYMDDADLVYPCQFFESVATQLRLLEKTPFNFLSFPAVYLTKSLSERILLEKDFDSFYPQIMHALLLEDPKGGPSNLSIKSYAPASGIVALRRDFALSVGGYDEEFSGWGGEDRDFIFRLLAANPKIELPASFRKTESWNLNDTLIYRGWRSLHRVHGEFIARQGLYATHIFHEESKWRSRLSSSWNIRRAAAKTQEVVIAKRDFDSCFDLRSSLLFDIYRTAATMEKINLSAELLLSSIHNHNRERLRGWRKGIGRKKSLVLKLLSSPRNFFGDSRFSVFRALARFFGD